MGILRAAAVPVSDYRVCRMPTNLIRLRLRRMARMRELNPMETIAAATTEADVSKQFNKKDLVTALAEQNHLSKRASQKMLDDLIILITKHLKKGEKVKITGLGILQVRKRAARMGRNPATGEAIKIKASKKVAFRATKELKLAI
jgi:DNA-binding protein HU-beta